MGDPLDDRAGVLFDDSHPHIREPLAKTRERLGKQIRRDGGDARDRDAGGPAARHLLDGGERRVEVVQQLTGLHQKLSPGRRHVNASGRPLQQIDTKTCFELLHASCEGWRR